MIGLLPSFKERIYLPEQMDAPDCDLQKLERTYIQLAIINRTLSRMTSLLQQHVLADIERIGGGATIAEFGCGGADVLAWLAKEGKRRGLRLHLVGVDSDPRAIVRARANLGRFENARAVVGSLADLQAVGADYVFSNHVLHHIAPDELVSVLSQLRGACNRKLLINDLERSAAAYSLYTALAALVFHRSYVFADGRLSIRKGFRIPELQKACAAAGYPVETLVQSVRPWRVVIVAPGGHQLRG